MWCRICDYEISDIQADEQHGLCNECYNNMLKLMYEDMCAGCPDEEYCKDNNTCCKEYDEEFERRLNDEV